MLFLRDIQCLSCCFKLSMATLKSSQVIPVFSNIIKWCTLELSFYITLYFSPSKGGLDTVILYLILHILWGTALHLGRGIFSSKYRKMKSKCSFTKIMEIVRHVRLSYIGLTSAIETCYNLKSKFGPTWPFTVCELTQAGSWDNHKLTARTQRVNLR